MSFSKSTVRKGSRKIEFNLAWRGSKWNIRASFLHLFTQVLETNFDKKTTWYVKRKKGMSVFNYEFLRVQNEIVKDETENLEIHVFLSSAYVVASNGDLSKTKYSISKVWFFTRMRKLWGVFRNFQLTWEKLLSQRRLRPNELHQPSHCGILCQ